MTNMNLGIDLTSHIRAEGNDRTTPRHIVDVLSPIDLDPCCNPWAITHPKHSFSKHNGEDGLLAEWHKMVDGLVYVNPPYGTGLIEPWSDKITKEASRGVMIATLVPLDPTTTWWKKLTSAAHAVIHVEYRVGFGGGGNSNPKPSAMVLHNCLQDREWNRLGRMWRPM